MHVIRKSALIATATMLLLAAFSLPAFAQSESNVNGCISDPQALQLRYDVVNARVSFTTGVLSDTAALVANASDLNSYVAELNGDLVTLGGYVAANDSQGFNAYVQDTINPAMTAAHQALKADMALFDEWGVTRETREALKEAYKERRAAYQAEIREITMEMASLRLTRYQDVIDRAGGRIDKLAQRGVGVTGMKNVVEGAEANVVNPLQAAIASGDVNATRAELKGKSLGNGNEYSFHFWAKSRLEALTATTDAIADNATAAGYGDQIVDIRAHLATVQSTLDEVGTAPYTAEQMEVIKTNLTQASDDLKGVLQGLKNAKKQPAGTAATAARPAAAGTRNHQG